MSDIVTRARQMILAQQRAKTCGLAPCKPEVYEQSITELITEVERLRGALKTALTIGGYGEGTTSDHS